MRGQPAEMRCRTCGYDLRGLTETRCPECGRAFDPGDPATYLVKPVSGLHLLAIALLGVILFVTPLAAAYTGLARHIPFVVVPLFIAAALLGGGLVAFFLLRTVGALIFELLF